ncbi:MAG: hypothetical protein ACLP8A_11985 [Methylovirgula sp.]
MRPHLIRLLLLLSLPQALSAPLAVTAARADEDPRQYCARVGNDDETRTPPASLAAAIKQLFDVDAQEAAGAAYFRCAGGKVLLCYVGANLSCGKADQRRSMAAADQWCSKNPNSKFIPMVVTGHDTPYEWRCVGRKAKTFGKSEPLDAHGFFADHWKVLP